MDLNLLDAELRGFLCSLLRSTLSGEWRALATSLETASSRAGPTQRVAFGIRDRHRRIVERRLDVRNSYGHIAACLAFLRLGHDGLTPVLISGADPVLIDAALAQVLDALFAGHSFLGALASACVSASSLATDRQSHSMPQSAVTLDIAQTVDILSQLTT